MNEKRTSSLSGRTQPKTAVRDRAQRQIRRGTTAVGLAATVGFAGLGVYVAASASEAHATTTTTTSGSSSSSSEQVGGTTATTPTTSGGSSSATTTPATESPTTTTPQPTYQAPSAVSGQS